MEKLSIEQFLNIGEFTQGSGDGAGDGISDGTGYGLGHSYGSDYGHGFGYGYGSGYSNGDAYGKGTGYGKGAGHGYESGDGHGDGCGYGNGSQIKSINGKAVYQINDIATIIDSVHFNYAKGYTLNSDLTTTPCFIAKCGNFFAHGKTLKDAFADARKKYEKSLPLEERIIAFNVKYPDNDKPISGRELFEWHHILTGSYRLGREQFCRERGLDINNTYTVKEFISITENAYGCGVIKQLKESRSI